MTGYPRHPGLRPPWSPGHPGHSLALGGSRPPGHSGLRPCPGHPGPRPLPGLPGTPGSCRASAPGPRHPGPWTPCDPGTLALGRFRDFGGSPIPGHSGLPSCPGPRHPGTWTPCGPAPRHPGPRQLPDSGHPGLAPYPVPRHPGTRALRPSAAPDFRAPAVPRPQAVRPPGTSGPGFLAPPAPRDPAAPGLRGTPWALGHPSPPRPRPWAPAPPFPRPLPRLSPLRTGARRAYPARFGCYVSWVVSASASASLCSRLPSGAGSAPAWVPNRRRCGQRAARAQPVRSARRGLPRARPAQACR